MTLVDPMAVGIRWPVHDDFRTDEAWFEHIAAAVDVVAVVVCDIRGLSSQYTLKELEHMLRPEFVTKLIVFGMPTDSAIQSLLAGAPIRSVETKEELQSFTRRITMSKEALRKFHRGLG